MIKLRLVPAEQLIRSLAKVLDANKVTKSQQELGLQSSCISCEHFEELGRPGAYEPEVCRLYKVRPPARVIAFGCEKYVDKDDIPF